jgi:beta-glucosidase
MPSELLSFNSLINMETGFNRADFGKDFKWGVSTAAYQIEGAISEAGKSLSIWDEFSNKKGKIKGGDNGDVACDFYNRYKDDLAMARYMGFEHFRFSTSWSRVLSEGSSSLNENGIGFYDRLVDECLETGLKPWITLYHWDLPLYLHKKGGWSNRDIIHWFEDYTQKVCKHLGDRVKDWMVLNEPMAFTGLGYLIGLHAPGHRSISKFKRAVHHAVLCQSIGSQVVRAEVQGAKIGSTFSCSAIHPSRVNGKDDKAVRRVDALLNRLFLEPALGLGYPEDALPFLRRMRNVIQPEDEAMMKADLDYVGLQNYTREIVKSAWYIPLMNARYIPAKKRDVPITAMSWEIYPEGIYEMLKKFQSYKEIKEIIVTENGVAFPDKLENGVVNDQERIDFYKAYLGQVLRAKNEGVNVTGYFPWTLMDNFEWAEGYHPRFGLIYVDFETQKRIIKNSGLWFKELLS